MARTAMQQLGDLGEKLVARKARCPRCKRQRTLKQLPANFKCADLVCDFCGFLAQVKTVRSSDVEKLPDQLRGAAWRPIKERMDAAIYLPLYLVLTNPLSQNATVWYLSPDVQEPEMYQPRQPLSEGTRRAGWQGVRYNLKPYKHLFVRIA